MIRAFVALTLPGRVVWQLEGAQAGLPVGRAVPAENFHLTLAFLGELRSTTLEDVHHALAEIRAPAFSVGIDGVDVFGGAQPTSLHARVAADPGLAHLQAKVQQAARTAGLAMKAGRYVPHVTLARFPKNMGAEDRARLQAFISGRVTLAIAPFVVEDFALYRSHLGKQARYEVLERYALDGVAGGGEDADADADAPWAESRFSAGW